MHFLFFLLKKNILELEDTENAAEKTLGIVQILYEKKLNRLGLCLRKGKIEEMRENSKFMGEPITATPYFS